MTSVQALITILAIAVGTQFTRWLPFWLFPEKKDPPAVVLYLGKVLPPAMMGLLTVYCFKNVSWLSGTLRLRVCRVKCSECGTTHALLLSSMVPFSQIPLSEQQRICNDYEEGRCVSMVCETNPSIDENNVKSILRNYRLCWREKLRSLRICLFPLDTLILSCFSDYSSQFMQIHRRVNRLFPYTT